MVHPPPPVRDVSTARRGVRDEQFPIARLAVEVPPRRRGRSRHWEPILNILMRWSFTARSSCRGFEISSICNAPVTRNNRFCSLAAESGLWRPFTIPPIHSPRDSIENQGSCRPKPSLPNRYVRFRQQDQLKVSPSVSGVAAVCDRLVAEASSAPGGERLISVVPPSRGPRRCGFSTIALATSQSRVFPRDDLGSGSAEGFRSTEGTTNGYRTGCPRVVVSSAGKATFIKDRRLPPGQSPVHQH